MRGSPDDSGLIHLQYKDYSGEKDPWVKKKNRGGESRGGELSQSHRGGKGAAAERGGPSTPQRRGGGRGSETLLIREVVLLAKQIGVADIFEHDAPERRVAALDQRAHHHTLAAVRAAEQRCAVGHRPNRL